MLDIGLKCHVHLVIRLYCHEQAFVVFSVGVGMVLACLFFHRVYGFKCVLMCISQAYACPPPSVVVTSFDKFVLHCPCRLML